MILHFEIKQSDNKPCMTNQRALLRYDAGVGRDKSHLITTKTSRLHYILCLLVCVFNFLVFKYGARCVLLLPEEVRPMQRTKRR